MSRAAPWLGLAAVLAATAVAYQPAVAGPFVLDDWNSIQANPELDAPGVIRLPSVVEMLGPGRPVTEVTFAVDIRAAGLDPRRFHAVSLLAHLAATVAAYAFLASLLARAGHPRPRALALFVAGLFALHPIQAESVAYAAQRAEVLASLLYLVALSLLDAAARTGRPWGSARGAAAWTGGGLAWLVGMGAKSVAITAPAAFLAEQAVVAPAGERGPGALRRRTLLALAVAAPLLALCAWSVALHLRAFAAAPEGAAGFGATALGPGAYFLTQLQVQWLYLSLLAWPGGLAFDRTFTPSTGLDLPAALAGAGVVALLALAAALWIRAERASGPRPAARLAAFGILFWFLALAPTSSIVPIADLAVEHRVYLACLGPFLAFAAGADALLHRLLSRPRAVVAAAVIGSLLWLATGAALVARARVWGSAEALWRHAAAASPDNPRAWVNVGTALQQRGDLGGADDAYRRAWALPRRPVLTSTLARNHSGLLLRLGRPAEALAMADAGLPLAPDDPDLHRHRALALGLLGRDAEALAEARRAVAVAPGDPRTQDLLGQALSRNGDPQGALAAFQAAASLAPATPLYLVEAAVTLAALGRRDEACSAVHQAARLAGAAPLPLDAPRHAAALGCPLPPR